MNPLDLSDAMPPRPREAEGHPSQGCPQCFGALLYNGRGYSCIACAYTCPLLGHPSCFGKGRSRPKPRKPDGPGP